MPVPPAIEALAGKLDLDMFAIRCRAPERDSVVALNDGVMIERAVQADGSTERVGKDKYKAGERDFF